VRDVHSGVRVEREGGFRARGEWRGGALSVLITPCIQRVDVVCLPRGRYVCFHIRVK
jgi:hypothetical protein